MKNYQKIIAGVVAAIFIILLCFTLRVSYETTSTTKGIDSALVMGTFSTSSQQLIATASTVVLATSTGRQYAVLVNDGANPIYLGFGKAAVVGQGIRLNATGGSYEINYENLYVGAINAIASGGSSNLTVTAKEDNNF